MYYLPYNTDPIPYALLLDGFRTMYCGRFRFGGSTRLLFTVLLSLIAGLDSIPKDSKGKVFIDRDGVLFRYILDYLRNSTVVLPENFHEKARLRAEAEFFQLEGLLKSLDSKSHPYHHSNSNNNG
jgi:hypothetical protein